MIRAARPGDAGAIASIYAPHVLHGAVSFETDAPDAAAMAARMAAGGDRYPWLVADDGNVLGYAYAGPFSERAAYRWAVETTVYVADAAHRRGVGRALYAALIDRLVRQGFAQAVARIALPSAPSVALHEAMGFSHVGTWQAIGFKHGRWIDVGIWQRPLAAVSEVPAEPLRADQLPSGLPREL